jgi:hypothetical protein
VQGDERNAGCGGPGGQLGVCVLDLTPAWQKAQDLAVRPCGKLTHGVDDGLGRRVLDCQRMGNTWNTSNWCPVEKARDRIDVERRRHDDDAEIGASEPGLLCQGKSQVAVHAALVELVEHDRREV